MTTPQAQKAAAAQVGEQSKECWVSETYLNNAVAATIERCTQVAEDWLKRAAPPGYDFSGLLAAIRKLRDDSRVAVND